MGLQITKLWAGHIFLQGHSVTQILHVHIVHIATYSSFLRHVNTGRGLIKSDKAKHLDDKLLKWQIKVHGHLSN